MDGFVRMSRYAGMREDLVQAGGGNSSYKQATDRMFIKASGLQLADVTKDFGYAVVDPTVIREAFMNVPDVDDISEETGKEILAHAFLGGKRPSIETFLHAVSGKYTLHTHPVVVNALACRIDGMDLLRKLFPKAVMVPYATPGVELAKAYFKVIRNNDRGSSGLIFLQNHGLIVSGDSAEWVIGETERVTGIIENELQTARMKPYHNMMKLWPYFPEKILWKVTDENVLRAYRAREEWDHAFCPDCIVFIGKRILKLDAKFGKDDIDRFIEKYDIPAVIDYGKSLYICADSVRTALEIQSVLSFSAQVMEMNQGVECRFLTEREQNYLMNWDAEKFRKNLKQK